MMTKESFQQQYEAMSDAELYQMHTNIQDYTEEARDALAIVIEQRGGMEAIVSNWEAGQLIRKEKHRIRQEVSKLYTPDAGAEFYSKLIVSEKLSDNEMIHLINDHISVLNTHQENITVKPRTVYGSLFGGLLSIIVGGSMWGIFLIETHRMFVFLAIAVVLICYFIIRFFTRQDQKNKVVLLATVVSSVLAFLFGQFLFEIFG